MDLILASGSPRRRELLDSIGVRYRVTKPAGIDEKRILESASGDIESSLCALALSKGRAVSSANPDCLVLSADTEVILDGEYLGKPSGAAAACEMLSRLAGRSHIVCTAVAVQCLTSGVELCAAEQTAVCLTELDPSLIRRYVERAVPFDFAGGYAIQGLGALLVKEIHGDYSNVVGLPLPLTARLLNLAGIRIL
jgi:septum formation protein